MLIGYARVSTRDQDTALQEDALRKAGGVSVTEAAKLSGVSRAALYRARTVSKTSRKLNGTHGGFETDFATEIRGNP